MGPTSDPLPGLLMSGLGVPIHLKHKFWRFGFQNQWFWLAWPLQPRGCGHFSGPSCLVAYQRLLQTQLVGFLELEGLQNPWFWLAWLLEMCGLCHLGCQIAWSPTKSMVGASSFPCYPTLVEGSSQLHPSYRGREGPPQELAGEDAKSSSDL